MTEKSYLFLMPLLFTGGSEKQVRMIIDGLSQRNCSIVVVVESSNEDIKADEKEFVQNHPNVKFIFAESFDAGVKTHALLEKYIAKFFSLLHLSKVIGEAVKKNSVNVAMVTNLTGLTLLPVFKYCGCKIIYNERNPGQSITNAFWKKFLLKKCDKIVCNSQNASKIMGNRLACDVPVIHNGVEEKKLSRHERSDVFNILVPARISKIKNQAVVLNALKLLPQIKVKAFFVGTKEDLSYLTLLQEIVKEHGLDNVVEFPGFTSDIDSYYKKTDLVILPSFEEGTPNVLLESFMRRIMCLASNIPMNNDCMMRKDLLFNPESPEDLSKKIESAFKMSMEDRAAIEDLNYKFVCEKYGVERMIDSYDKLFKGV